MFRVLDLTKPLFYQGDSICIIKVTLIGADTYFVIQNSDGDITGVRLHELYNYGD